LECGDVTPLSFDFLLRCFAVECGDVTPLSFVSLFWISLLNSADQIQASEKENKRKRRYIAALHSETEKQKKAALHRRTPNPKQGAWGPKLWTRSVSV
jgi:hypothetical protein